VLSDPISSRVHAFIWRDGDGWWVRDAASRNGTFVDDQKIDTARLANGQVLRIGATEFLFSVGKPPSHEEPDALRQETVVLDRPFEFATSQITRDDSDGVLTERDIGQLYDLSRRMLSSTDPDDVISTALGMLKEWSEATVVGFLWLDEEGQLRPKLVLPRESAGKVALSRRLTERVVKQCHAVHVNRNNAISATQSLDAFEEAICTPLIDAEKRTLGAIHLYRARGRFLPRDFAMALEVAGTLVIALPQARRWTSLQADRDRLAQASAAFDELIGECAPMQELKRKIGRVARAPGCVLVRGESGCGKELVARAIHRASPRADRPMLSVNCAAIPRDLMESQLFGHRKGAFTGAESDHIGWFEQAHSATLFLDEVGEMTLEGQAKLLRVLEGHPFLPVGASDEVRVDVRVIAATNRDLRDFVRDGKFRDDLYYRLSVFELFIPPLRDRGPDIEELIDFFFDHFRTQHGRKQLRLTAEARQKLLSYEWPGNIRQLRNVIDSAIVLAEGDTVEPDDFGLRDVGGDELVSLNIEQWERKLIRKALERTGGNIPEAAKLLGIGRATLYRRVDDQKSV